MSYMNKSTKLKGAKGIRDDSKDLPRKGTYRNESWNFWGCHLKWLWGTLTRIPGSFFFLPLLTHEMWDPTRYHNSSYRVEKKNQSPIYFRLFRWAPTMSSPAVFDVIRASIDHHKHIVQPQPTKMKSWWHIGFFFGWGLPLKFRIPEPKKVIFNCSGDDFYRREQLASQI